MFIQQLEAYEKFKNLKVGALFMRMGTGKTRVAIELVDYNKCDLLIYVAPFSVLDNIRAELKKWNLKTKYILIGYETISMSEKKYLELLSYIEGKKCFIVADESIFIKNDTTKRFNRLCHIRSKCEYALILNGTPLAKNEWDLYNQMYFLSPLIINMSRNQFLNSFFKKITFKRKHETREHTFYKLSEVNAKILHKMIEPYIFEADLDFDKNVNETYHFIKYNEDDKYYKEKEKKLNEYKETGKAEIIINMLNLLAIIANECYEKNDEVVKYIQNKQIVVYCSLLSEVKFIQSKINCHVITGKTPINKRFDIIEKFKNDTIPLIMTFGTGAFSLNLQFCNEIVFSSLLFDYGKIEQAKHRIKRIGQERDINYTYFLTDLGINKLILENLKRKQTLENLVKEKIMKEGLEWLKYI